MFHIARAPLFRLHKPQSIRLLLSCNGFSSDSNAPGDGNDKPKTKSAARKTEKSEEEGKKSSAALNRLNELLAMMNTENELKLVKKVDLPRPKAKKSKDKKADSDSDSDDDERPKDLAQATRKVATALGGDAKRTESELLSKLLGTASPATGESNLTDIITGMVVDKSTKKQHTEHDATRSTLVKKSIDSKRAKQRRPTEPGDQTYGVASPKERYERKRFSPKQPPQTLGGPGSVKLFDEEPLGIFTDLASLKESPDKLQTWQKLNERELRLAVTHPPANYFQKMALWTEQGKLWKFPINNEQGREEEAQVAFTEHVFLEEHLEPWCPSKGPIRHFMELVCVGLSKNHYITAQEKRDHIFWFRDYFEQKKEILKDIIVAESSGGGGGGKTKEIEQ
uniref:Small ribosomal subunit protein mS31 n=1 Tax=Anopheles maculatus TaxID=74869 RepID=A0A182SMT9_9DIPT